MISFTCPVCKKNYENIENVSLGQKIECTSCHSTFIISKGSEKTKNNVSQSDSFYQNAQKDNFSESQQLICPNCSEPLLQDALFCGHCGKEIKKNKGTPVNETSQVNNDQDNDKQTKTMQQKSEELSKIGNRFVAKALGVEKLEGFSFSKFFSQIFKHHSWDEMEELVAVGTNKTTPPLSDISTDWPTPWFFFRVIVFFIAAYLIVIWRIDDLGVNAPMILLLFGIIGMPFAALSFFFEINILKNISIMQVGKLVCVGGFISVLATLIVSRFVSYSSPVWAGPIEEIVKGAVMLLFIRNLKYKYKLNGLLIGASIGVGFAIIETAGYIVDAGVGMEEKTMMTRAFFAPIGHVLYSSLVGYALWESRKNGYFVFSGLINGKTIRPIILAIALHMFWNSELLNSEVIIKTLIVAFCGYGAVVYLIQDCMKEIRDLKQEI